MIRNKLCNKIIFKFDLVVPEIIAFNPTKNEIWRAIRKKKNIFLNKTQRKISSLKDYVTL